MVWAISRVESGMRDASSVAVETGSVGLSGPGQDQHWQAQLGDELAWRQV